MQTVRARTLVSADSATILWPTRWRELEDDCERGTMKATKLTVLCLLLLPFTAGCEGDTKAAGGNDGTSVDEGTKGILGGLEGLDPSKLGVEGMQQKTDELIGMLKSKFESIQDEAGAIDVKKTAEPLIAQLGTLKTALGDKLPSLAELSKVVDDVEAKFQGNEAVMKVLKPVLDQVRKLTA